MTQDIAPKLRRVKITSSHGLTKVFFSDTGEEIPHVQRIKFEHNLYGRAIVYVDQVFLLDEFDIVGECPSVKTLDEAKADDEAFALELKEIKDSTEQVK